VARVYLVRGAEDGCEVARADDELGDVLLARGPMEESESLLARSHQILLREKRLLPPAAA
jgi:hypothetical protein